MLKWLNPNDIIADWKVNPRERDEDHIRSLAAHMNEVGYIKEYPILVYELSDIGDGNLYAATGHHRLAAATLELDEFPNLPLEEVYVEVLHGTRTDYFRRMLTDNFEHTPGFNRYIGKMPSRRELRTMRYRLLFFPDNFAKGDRLLAKEWGCDGKSIGEIRDAIIKDLGSGNNPVYGNIYACYVTDSDVQRIKEIIAEDLYIGIDGKKRKRTKVDYKPTVNLPTAENSAVEKADQSDSEASDLERERTRADTNRKRMWSHISSEIRTKAGITHPELSDTDIAKAAADALGLRRIEVYKEGVDFSFQAHKFIMGDIESPAYSVYDCVLNDAIAWTDRFRKIYDDIGNRAEWVVALLKSEEAVSGGVDALWAEIRSEMPAWETYFKTEGYQGKSVDVSGATEHLLLKNYLDIDEMEDATETDVGIILSHMQLRVPALALRVSEALKGETKSDAFAPANNDGTPPPNRKALKALHLSAVVNVQSAFFTADLDAHESFTHIPRVETGKKAQAFFKRIVAEKDLRLNIFSEDYWHKTGDTYEATYPDMYRGRDLRNDEIEAEIEVLKGIAADIHSFSEGTSIQWIENTLTIDWKDARTEAEAPDTEEAEGEPDYEQIQEDHVKRLEALPDEIKAALPAWKAQHAIQGNITLRFLVNARCQLEFGRERGPDPFFREEMEEILQQMQSNDADFAKKVCELLDSDNTADAPDMDALWAEFNKRYPKWKAKYAESGYKENDLIQASTEAEMLDALRIYRENDRTGMPTADEVKDMTDLMNMQSYPFAHALREMLRSKKEEESETLGESEYGLDTLMIGYYKRGQRSDIRYLSFKVIGSRQLDDIPMKELPESLRNEVLKLVEEEAS